MELIFYTLTTFIFLNLHAVITSYSKENQLKDAKIKVYANSEVPYGEKTPVMVTLAKYPTNPIVLHLSTPKYLLLYLKVGGSNIEEPPYKFNKSDNISEELKLHNIVSSELPAYETGFFVVVTATFWDFYDSLLTLNGFVVGQAQVKPVKDVLMVNHMKPNMCVPELIVKDCSNPNSPYSVIIGQGADLRADLITVYNHTCDMRNASFSWTIMDLKEEKLKTFSQIQTTRFTLRPYVLSFPTQYELWRNQYVILVEGEQNGVKFAGRCYLKTPQERVEAIIRGGEFKQVYHDDILIINGSQSRDYSKPPRRGKQKQFRIYYWECPSDASRNKACRQKKSNSPILKFRKNSFRLGFHYKFKLRVVADYNPKIEDIAYQTVEMVDVKCLEVGIICQSNCAHNRYNANTKIVLIAQCYNCATKRTPNYSWYVNQVLKHSKQRLVEHPILNAISTEIKLVIRTSDGRTGSETRILKPLIPPHPGKCKINPTHGMEAHTKFYVCCTNFTTTSLNEPLEYFYYANRVLLTSCRDCNCESYLPLHISYVKVFICDKRKTCTTMRVPVNVFPLANITMDTPDKLWKFITTPPTDVVGQAAKGENTLQMMAYVQALANRIQDEPDKAMVLINAYDNVHPTTCSALGKLANLTQTLALHLTPIDPDDERVLTRSVRKLNEIFRFINNTGRYHLLVKEPLINVTVSCITVHTIMAHINKQLPRPPQAIYSKYMQAYRSRKLQQPVIDKLLDEINNYCNEGVKSRSLIWLNSTWETERLYRFLRFARTLGIQDDDSGFNKVGVSLRNTCFDIEPGRSYTIDSTDHMHTVFFSPELLQETKDPNNITICLKVISTIRELNWWYPDNMQPSNVLLTVHIYTGEDNFKEERHLKNSVIKHRTVIGKFKPARDEPNITMDQQRTTRFHDFYEEENLIEDMEDEDSVADTGKFINCLTQGSLETMRDLRVYRINLDEQSMLAVRFQHTTHRLRALLIMDKLPNKLGQTIRNSGCILPADSRNSTMLMRNNCLKFHRVYLALLVDGVTRDGNITVPGGPANFSFVFQVRSCDYWMYSLGGDKQRWSHVSCLPGLEYPRMDSLECTCTVLGTYTSYVYHVPAIAVPTNEHVPVSINWWFLMSFILVLILLLLWLVVLFKFYNKPHCKTILCDMTGLEDESKGDVHDLLVYLKTGGQMNAVTTATVRIIFETEHRTELQFTLMQDPEHPELTRNSTYVLWLRTRDIRIPTRMAISHNNAGRYPSWFLRRVELVDLQDQLTQVFVVHHWVRQKFLVLSSDFVFNVGDRKAFLPWRKRFTNELERLWINWGLWHPLTGMWREGSFNDNMTRAHRVSIFLTKIIVVYCVCACYLGPTTPETVAADRKKIVEYRDLVKMFMISFVLTNLVHFLLESCILKKK